MIRLPREWQAEHMRVDFGRRKPQPKRTNYVALALYAVFVGSMYAALTTSKPGAAVLFVVLAFGALLAGMAAANDA
jgi:hypothetical protein